MSFSVIIAISIPFLILSIIIFLWLTHKD